MAGGNGCTCGICRRHDAFSNRHFRDYARAGLFARDSGKGVWNHSRRGARKIRRLRENRAWMRDYLTAY